MNFEECLSKYGKLIYSNKGTSMLPLLREGKDLFVIEKKSSQRCRRGDVVLFRRGKDYVLHRIVAVRNDDYVILGDNCITYERGIIDNDILGIMTAFVRNGREYSVNNLCYRIYSFIWLNTSAIRILIKKGIHYVRKLCK